MSDLFASRKVMRNYLNALLTEEQEPAPVAVQKQQLNKLLADVKPQTTIPEAKIVKPVISPPAEPMKPPVVTVSEIMPKQAPAVKIAVPPPVVPVPVQKEYRQGKFQALFFDVAGLKVALPLKELGGIHKMGTLNTLPGKPDWYKGDVVSRAENQCREYRNVGDARKI